MLAETWIGGDISNTEIGSNNYNLYQTDKSMMTNNYKRSGGVAVCVYKSLS